MLDCCSFKPERLLPLQALLSEKLNLIILLFFVLALVVLGTLLSTNTRTVDNIAGVVLVVEYHVCCSHPCWTPVREQPPFFGHLVGN